MNASVVPADVAAALAARGLEPTGRIGASGWLAREPGGSLVELVVLPAAPDDAAAAAATALRHEHLAPVLGVVDVPGGRGAMLVGHVAGTTLAAVRRARVPLTDGEAATLAVPLARALGALHAAGLCHGPLAAEQVILTPGGRPVLAASGSWPAAGGAQDGDVRGLLTLLLDVMAPPAAVPDDDWDEVPDLRPPLEDLLRDGCCDPERVVRACLATVSPEPVRMPDAGALARAHVLDPVGGEPGTKSRPGALPRRPVRSSRGRLRPGARQEGRRARRRRARRRTRLVTAGLVVALGLLVVLLRPMGVVLADDGPSHGAAGAGDGGLSVAGAADGTSVVAKAGEDGSAAADDAKAGGDGSAAAGDVDASLPAEPIRDRAAPVAAAAALTRLRAAVIASGEPARLDEVDVVGGEAHAADEELMATLGADRVADLGADVRDAAEVMRDESQADATVWVRVTSAMGPYTRTAPDGTSTRVAGTVPRAAVLVLRWTEDGWRVASVSDPEAVT